MPRSVVVESDEASQVTLELVGRQELVAGGLDLAAALGTVWDVKHPDAAASDKVDGKRKAGELKKAAAEIEREVAIWLAVLARCFELQDESAGVRELVPGGVGLDHLAAVLPDPAGGPGAASERGRGRAVRSSWS